MSKIKKREHKYDATAILRLRKQIKDAYTRNAKELGISYSELMRRVLERYYEKNTT